MTDLDDRFRIVRIRGKDASNCDHAKRAWEMGQVGVWYGAWSPEELDNAIEKRSEEGKVTALEYLANTKRQKKLDWGESYPEKMFDTCWRFQDITENRDWVVVYFDDALHLGQLQGGIETNEDHDLNNDNGELFHFRRLINKKCFPFTDLPDSFRLLTSAGRGNVHQHNDIYTRLLKLLAKNPNSEAVKDYFATLKTAEWLEFLGPTDWESLCLGYLIIEYDYVPTGLLAGRTLSVYDLVGKTLGGKRILGQCKKTPDPYDVEEDFLSTRENYRDRDEILWFWFSYGGWTKDPGFDIQLVDKKCIKKWLEGKRGKEYLKVFKGSKRPQVK
ncbi:hypothetical protein [Candidatus Spongiihabitans sp.]|uniref:hypothetical protein n=1 Tax=Candidatus Spongiihabitans sp. TaxID=3101308 RepID=UPI003C7A5CBF